MTTAFIRGDEHNLNINKCLCKFFNKIYVELKIEVKLSSVDEILHFKMTLEKPSWNLWTSKISFCEYKKFVEATVNGLR